ncbi:BaiN/RdsA family NAD(P)/FAD-dependent oxidoreductase [Dongshaea marina]|uniref:NAD(P)/FAD-dependent oxidoreductase n=1 Tax=Dongshaea marina TaxID=2047966 RepID=UPI000D3EAA96|nr:NAD(P)/FAD-dependent oxidoreductase [Dongshaea marina]
MCAATAARRGLRVLVLEHGKRPGRKLLISGGGRCNFTNKDLTPADFVSANPHFCKSALARFTPWDFIALVEKHGIPYHERDWGQLFCDESAKAIVELLISECRSAGVEFSYQCKVEQVARQETGFALSTSQGDLVCDSLVVASGGLSMPKLGASAFGWQLAEEFGLEVIPPRAGLVPLTLHTEDKERFGELSGIALRAEVFAEGGASFRENVLFTHRGLSGPAILQISSYWLPGERVRIDWLGELDIVSELLTQQKAHPGQSLKNTLSSYYPKRFVSAILGELKFLEQPLKGLGPKQFELVAESLRNWSILPNGTEGYRTAEVTLGGVNCQELSSKTMEARKVKGLYFIGEVVDVAGHLGGFNFQWAWSSGVAAGNALKIE